MRILPIIGVTALLALSACGDDSTDTSSSQPAVAASSPDATGPQAGGTEATAAITPIVICYDMSDELPDYAFAYKNDNDTAVAVSRSDSTAFETEDADVALAPTLFAPGLVSPVLWLSAPDYEGYPGWTIKGPDGEERTATADNTTPECTDDLLKPTTPDTRTPAIELTSITPSADGKTADVLFTLTGVDASVCPEGLTPEAPSITWTTDNATSEGPTFGTTVTIGTYGDGTADGGVGASVTVFDRCSGAGQVQETWPGGAPFEKLYEGVGYCIVDKDGDIVALEAGDPECPTLPETGGTKVRPG